MDFHKTGLKIHRILGRNIITSQIIALYFYFQKKVLYLQCLRQSIKNSQMMAVFKTCSLLFKLFIAVSKYCQFLIFIIMRNMLKDSRSKTTSSHSTIIITLFFSLIFFIIIFFFHNHLVLTWTSFKTSTLKTTNTM